MKYILDEHWRFRGWRDAQTGLWNTADNRVRFLAKPQYLLLLRCDGAHDLEAAELTENDRSFLDWLLREGVVRPAAFAEFLRPEQDHRSYPAHFKQSAQWSVTGACNLKCRHCFMSAPHAKHGSPSFEQLRGIAEQLAECGVFHVSLTGGEPLIREDLFKLIDLLTEREIAVDTIYTNGWLLDGRFLDKLEKRKLHPSFQLSFDGVGRHDLLRGVPGAEERALNALKLLQERGIFTTVSMCLHRGNRDTLRDTVKLLASLGVKSLKCASAFELGEWMQPEVMDLRLSGEEELEVFEKYIPQYFEDDAPMPVSLSGAFHYAPGSRTWGTHYVRRCTADRESRTAACSVLVQNFYIGADGMVCPCMGMADTAYADSFPNLLKTPLKEILGDSDFERLCRTTVKAVRDGSGKCRGCRFADRCAGGCRNSALVSGADFTGADPGYCFFFEHDGEARIRAAAQEAFEAYLRRNPLPGETGNPALATAECP